MNVPDNVLCTELLHAVHAMRVGLQGLAEAHNLTLQQLAVLHQLQEVGMVPMGVLAERMYCDASNITGLVDRLVYQGLVERQEVPEDRRARRLCLTPAGCEVIAQAARQLPHALGVGQLTAAEKTQFHGLLQKVVRPTG